MANFSSEFGTYEKIELRSLLEAHNLIEALKNDGINLKNKKVLDVGCGLGYKSAKMSYEGAEVYGVEPLDSRVAWAISRGEISKSNIFNCRIQDLPREMFGQFDLVTVFAYRIMPEEIHDDYFSMTSWLGEEINRMQLEVTKAIGKLIKPDGELIIEIYSRSCDDYLHSPEEYCTPLMLQIKKAFAQSCYADLSNDNIFIKANSIRLDDVENIRTRDINASCLSENRPKFYLQSELTKQGCYYNGKHARLVWDISNDCETMVYSRPGTSESERKLKLTRAEHDRKMHGTYCAEI